MVIFGVFFSTNCLVCFLQCVPSLPVCVHLCVAVIAAQTGLLLCAVCCACVCVCVYVFCSGHVHGSSAWCFFLFAFYILFCFSPPHLGLLPPPSSHPSPPLHHDCVSPHPLFQPLLLRRLHNCALFSAPPWQMCSDTLHCSCVTSTMAVSGDGRKEGRRRGRKGKNKNVT